MGRRDDGLPGVPAVVHGPTIVHVYFDNGSVAPAVGEECTTGVIDPPKDLPIGTAPTTWGRILSLYRGSGARP